METLYTSACYADPLDIRKSRIYCENTLITYGEQRMILELIRSKRPRKILEIGVHAGGTSALVLHCLHMLNIPSELYSVDLAEQIHASDSDRETGFLVSELRSQYPCSDRWKLYTGCTVARVIEEIGGEIDFLILDAAHILPGEVLDFLTVLPYLSENATVVMHDILAATKGVAADWYATGILYSAVVADKFSLIRDFPGIFCGSICNIGAFQVTEDTKKYVENLFLLLYLPWPCIPAPEHIQDYLTILKKHYSEDLYTLIYNLYNRELFADGRPHLRYENLLKLRTHKDATVAVWGAKNAEKVGLGCKLYTEIHDYDWSSAARTGKMPFDGMLRKFHQSMYFIDNHVEQLQEDEFAQLLPFRDKTVLAHDKNLAAVIIAAISTKSRIEILSELQKMNIPDNKIHFIEEFMDD